MHLCSIALYRYHGIANPFGGRRRKRVCRLVVPAWSISVVLLVPFVVQACYDPSNVIDVSKDASDGSLRVSCGIFNRMFATCSSLVSFFIPLMVMTVVEILSIQTLRKRNHMKCISKLASTISASYIKELESSHCEKHFSDSNKTETSSSQVKFDDNKTRKIRKDFLSFLKPRFCSKNPHKDCLMVLEETKNISSFQEQQMYKPNKSLITQENKEIKNINLEPKRISKQNMVINQETIIEKDKHKKNLIFSFRKKKSLLKTYTTRLEQKRRNLVQSDINSNDNSSVNSNLCVHSRSKSTINDGATSEFLSNKRNYSSKMDRESDYIKSNFCSFRDYLNTSKNSISKKYSGKKESAPNYTNFLEVEKVNTYSENKNNISNFVDTKMDLNLKIKNEGNAKNRNFGSLSRITSMNEHIPMNKIHKVKTTNLIMTCYSDAHHSKSNQSSENLKDGIQLDTQTSKHLKKGILKKYPSHKTASNEEHEMTNTARQVRMKNRSASLVILEMLTSGGGFRTTGRERRAEKALIWVFLVFVLLWMPFFSTNLVYGLCGICDVPAALFHTFTWLGYLSSGVNPAIYTLLNRDFRVAFQNILCCSNFQKKFKKKRCLRNQTPKSRASLPTNVSNSSLSIICLNK